MNEEKEINKEERQEFRFEVEKINAKTEIALHCPKCYTILFWISIEGDQFKVIAQRSCEHYKSVIKTIQEQVISDTKEQTKQETFIFSVKPN